MANGFMSKKTRKTLIPYIYCAPGILFMLVFILFPIALSLVMSFFKIESLGATWEFVAFRNYVSSFRQKEFMNAFLRTLGFGAFSIVTGLFFTLLTSLLVAKHRFLSFYRYVFYLPAVVSAITMGKVWNLMLTPNETGLMNIIVMSVFGVGEPVNWLGDPKIAYMVVMGIGLVGCGGGMGLILFTTAINDIPRDLNEAAAIEGVNAFQRAWYITLPLIKPVMLSWLLLSVISAFKSFELIFSLTGGGPGDATTTLAILLYNNSSGSVFGYGSSAAMGFLLTLVVMFFAIIYVKVTKFGKAVSE